MEGTQARELHVTSVRKEMLQSRAIEEPRGPGLCGGRMLEESLHELPQGDVFEGLWVKARKEGSCLRLAVGLRGTTATTSVVVVDDVPHSMTPLDEKRFEHINLSCYQ